MISNHYFIGKWIASITIALASINVAAQNKITVLTIPSFEKSKFFQTYKLRGNEPYKLRNGGINFGFSAEDPEPNVNRITVELGDNQLFITRASVIFYGRSINLPAQLTDKREQFIKDFATSVEPNANLTEIIKYIHLNQKLNYPGGSDKIPRNQIGSLSIYAGRNGESLIIGFEK